MSFYGHPFFIQQQRAQQQPHPTVADLADEERTALAYLRSVQRRREAAEAAAALEARQRAAAAQRHQAAVRAAAEQQAALVAAARRERAIRETLERERAREEALALALEQRRQEAIARAIDAERERQANAARAYQSAMKQYRQQGRDRCGQAQCCRIAPASASASASASPALVVPQFAQPEVVAKPAPEPETRQAPEEEDSDSEEIDFEGINQLLGSLFGFNVAKEDIAALRAEQAANVPTRAKAPSAEAAPAKSAPATAASESKEDTAAVERLAKAAVEVEKPKNEAKLESKPEPKKTETKSEPKPKSDQPEPKKVDATPAPADDAADPPEVPLNPEAKPFVPAPTPSQGELPPELNQLLNAFLGLQVDPAGEGETGGAGKVVGDAVVNLNDILQRYGLEFVPDEDAPTEGIESASSVPKKSEESKESKKESKEPATEPHVPEFIKLDGPKSPEAKEPHPAAPEAEDTAPVVRAEPHAEPTPATKDEKPEEDIPAPPSPEVAADHAPEFISAGPPAHEREHKNTPFTSTLDHHSKMPPQLRDILANVETAMNALNEEDADKPCNDDTCACDDATKAKCNSGKPCAKPCSKKRRNQRERKARAPKPKDAGAPEQVSPERKASLAKLDDIDKQLKELTDNFTFPPNLGFAKSTPDGSQPPLLFNRHNTPYHAQAHALLQLILACDGVLSDGDRVIRKRRKDLVGRINKALAALEARRDRRWAEVRARRERGESDDEDERTTSTSDSETEGYELI